MSLNIYPDLRQIKCEYCYSDFISIEMGNFKMPRCSSCNKNPSKYVLSLRVDDGSKRNVKVRYNHHGERITTESMAYAMGIVILDEVRRGIFNPQRYESIRHRQKLVFMHFVEDIYLPHHQKRMERGDIAPSSYREKLSIYRSNLKAYFSDMALSSITRSDIKRFRESYTDRFSARNKALEEIRAILNFAFREDYIDRVPHIEKIPKSRIRKTVLTMSQARKIVAHINDEFYKPVFEFLLIYPLRPCEVADLRWHNIDFDNKKIIIDSHLSIGKPISGRKSLKDDVLELDLTDKAAALLQSMPLPFDKSMLVFKGRRGARLGNPVRRVWNKAVINAGYPKGKFNLYQLRHARLSELSQKLGGNLMKLKRISGHKSTRMLEERYVRDDSELSDYL
jgi:integrase